MKILLIGDSWGVGVFSGTGAGYGPTGQGVQTVLENQGHTVINISKGGGSNWLMMDRLDGHWGNTGRCIFGTNEQDRVDFNLNEIDYLVFFQTDIFRERHYYDKQYPTDIDTKWKVLEQDFVDSLQQYQALDDIFDDYFNKFYTKLNSYNKKVLCIGGWSQLHPSISNYNNLVAVIPSSTKLLIPELTQDLYLSDPEWYIQLSNDTKFMNKFGNEFKSMVVSNAKKLELIYNHWHEVHPPMEGYETLAKKILKYLL